MANPWWTPRRAFVPPLDTQAREDRSPPTMCRHGHMRAGDAMVFRITSGTVSINACQGGTYDSATPHCCVDRGRLSRRRVPHPSVRTPTAWRACRYGVLDQGSRGDL